MTDNITVKDSTGTVKTVRTTDNAGVHLPHQQVDIGPTVSTTTITSVSSSASNVTLLASNTARKGLIIQNTDVNKLYVKYGATADTSTGWTVIVPPNSIWEMGPPIYTGRIDGIWTAAGTGAAQITEM